jgi:hypothetical protein
LEPATASTKLLAADAAIIYYKWTALSGFEGQAIFRCGALTDAGKLALKPM